MKKYTQKTIKTIATMMIVSSFNLQAFSFFKDSPIECISKTKGKISFVNILLNTPGMKVKYAIAKSRALDKISTPSKTANKYIDGKKIAIKEILSHRKKINHGVSSSYVYSLLSSYQKELSECQKESKGGRK